MKNQINLKPEIFAQQFSIKERRIYWAFIIFGFFGALAWAGFDYYQYWQLDQKVQQAKLEKDEVLFMLEGLSGENSEVVDFETIEKKMQQNMQLLEQKNLLLNALRKNNNQSDQGFYDFIELLSQRKSPNMQLTQIFVRQQDNTQQLLLRGKVNQADVVPNYILNLENSLLNNIKFNFMQMDYRSSEDEVGAYYFSIATGNVNGDAL